MLAMKSFYLLLFFAGMIAPARAATEQGISNLLRPIETPKKDVPEKARRALDALWPAVHATRRAWPGYDLLEKPLLVAFTDGSALLLEHPNPPPEFRRIVYRGMAAYIADRGPKLNFSFSLKYEFSGALIAAVREDPAVRAHDPVLFAVHEGFHRHQDRFNFVPVYRAYEVEDGEDVALATLENRALAAWLEHGGSEALLDFAALRLRRRKLFPESAAETSEENLEGTAQYVEAAAEESIRGAAAARESLLVKLRPAVAAKNMAKRRLYTIGAVLGRVLESTRPGAWQGQVEAGRSMSVIFLSSMPLADDEAEARADLLASGPEYERLLAAARGDTHERKRRHADARLRYDAQPGRRVELWPGKLDRGFEDDGDWFFYPDGKLLHEHTVAWTGDGKAGRFRLADMPILESHRGDDRAVEFVTEAEILVDGRPWDQREGPFRSLTILGRGVDAAFNAGRVERRGETLVIVPAAD